MARDCELMRQELNQKVDEMVQLRKLLRKKLKKLKAGFEPNELITTTRSGAEQQPKHNTREM